MLVLPISLLIGGLLLGLRHSFEADHVAAVSAMVSRSKSLKDSSMLGAIWGFGHTATILLALLFVVVFKSAIPLSFTKIAELVVGLMLILLGAFSLKGFLQGWHSHAHRHGGKMHVHFHGHQPLRKAGENLHEHSHQMLKAKTFLIGSLHGLAGSGALVVLLGALNASVMATFVYAMLFGIGSTAGMALSSSAVGIAFTNGQFAAMHRYLGLGTGFLGVVVGILHISAI